MRKLKVKNVAADLEKLTYFLVWPAKTENHRWIIRFT